MGIRGIFREGMKERRRRKDLGRRKKDLKEKEKTYGDQLAALGQKAWVSKLNIEGYGDLPGLLTATQGQLDALQAQTAALRRQVREAEEKKKKEIERFVDSRREEENKKRAVDCRLSEEKTLLRSAQKETEAVSSRLSQIPREREQSNKRRLDAATPELEKQKILEKLENLAREEEELKRKYQEKTENAARLNERIAPIQQEADQRQKKLDEISVQQKQAVGKLDTDLSELKKALGEGEGKSQDVERVQQSHFRSLGEKLSAAKDSDAQVAEEMAALRATEKEMADVNTRITEQEGQKNPAGERAYRSMVVIITGGLLLAVAVVIALFLLL